jgi:hypothetical protein
VDSADIGLENFQGLTGISCPTVALCVAVEGSGDAARVGNIFTSTNPTGGAGAWTVAPNIDGNAGFGGPSGVSCPSASLCVAVDRAGNVLTSTNPTGGAGAWVVTNVESGALGGLAGVSCASASLCAAVDYAGNVVTSTNPTGGPGAWHITHVGVDLRSVSCTLPSQCVAVDSGNGDVATSTNPTGGVAAWQTSNIDDRPDLVGVSCATSSLCVAVDDINAVVGRDLALLPPSRAQIKAQLLRGLIPKGKAAKIATMLKNHGYRLSTKALAAGRAVIAWYYVPRGAHITAVKPRPVLVAAGSRKFTRAGTATIRITLTRTGNQLLKNATHLTLTAKAIFTPANATAVVATRTFALKH